MAIINQDRLKAELLSYYCGHRWGFEVVGVDVSATEGLATVGVTRPDLVLLSGSLPDLDPAEVVRRIHSGSPASKIILQTSRCDAHFLHSIGRTEYHGLLYDAEESPESLGRAIERVRDGLRAVSTRIIQGQAQLRADPVAFNKLLSRREQQVLTCIAGAMSDEEIGERLGLSRGTALVHRRKIMQKLSINSTPKLILYCLQKGFQPLPPLSPEPSFST